MEMTFFKLLAPITYWALIVMWSFILRFYVKRLQADWHKGSLMLLLFIILTIDAFRTLFESFYFGAWYTSLAGLLPIDIKDFLELPQMVIIPKLLNVFAAVLIITILFRYWLPKEGEEIEHLESTVDKRTRELSEAVRKLESEIKHRRLTEKKLKESEAKYIDLYENAPDMYVSVNGKTALIEKCNITLVKALGYSKEEIINRPVFTIYHPDCREKAKEAFKLFIEIGQVHDKELQLLRKDGSKLDVSLNATAVRDEDGNIIISRSTLRDITERRRNNAINKTRLHLMQFAAIHSLDEFLEESLNETERLTGSKIGFYHFMEKDQKTFKLQSWSKRTKTEFCKDNGDELHFSLDESGVWGNCVYTREPVIHNDYVSFMHEKGMPQGRIVVNRELIVPVLREDKLVAIFGIGNKEHDYDEKDIELISSIADISWEIAERKLAEEALRKREQRYRLSQNAARIGTWEYDINTEHFWGSDEANLIYGFDLEIISLPIETVESCIPERKRVHQALIDLIEKGKPYNLEFEIRPADGSMPKIISSIAELFLDKHGVPVKVIGVIQDITERKRTEQRIMELNNELEGRVAERTIQLETANKELEAFAYSVSHDLQAPLRSIDGFSQILLEDYREKIDEEGRDYLKRIRISTQRMGLLINDLLRLSRITRIELNIQQVNLSKIAEEISKNQKTVQADRKIRYIIESGIEVKGDKRLLRIVMENLFDNAWKFTSRQKNVRIEFGAETQKEERIYYVRDNGAGFDMKYSQKLFGAFQRLHTEKEFPGTGIGLATVQRIIHRHGGKVWAEGEVERGAVIYFTINTKR